MKIRLTLNGKKIEAEIKADTLLLDLVREKGCYSVKRGCETSNCGLCTVWLDGKPVLSCSVLAARADGHEVTTLEGLQKESEEFADFLAREGADQCGFCSPGFIMNVLAMERELVNRLWKRCGSIWQEISAAVPDTPASSVPWKNI